MQFQSILYRDKDADVPREVREEPPYFIDLNLDKMVAALTEGPSRADLAPSFYTRLTSPDAIVYRQEVMQDLEDKSLLKIVGRFSERMYESHLRLQQVGKLYNKYDQARRFLSAAEIYCESVAELWQGVARSQLKSRGMLAFREYLGAYIATERFKQLSAEAAKIKSDLSAIIYSLVIEDGAITVQHYSGEPDFTPVIEQTFEKFSRGATHDHLSKLPRWDSMNHIQEQVLNRLALLHSEIFGRLESFRDEQREFLDETLSRFFREIRFYVTYLEYIEPMRKAGLSFCYPQLTSASKEVEAHDAFDLALAHKRVHEGAEVVCNDFALRDPERIVVVSGPNQGGKTTFARMFGQLHFLASLGCPVPGSRGRLFIFDRLFTHFEREENIENLRGKLQDDLVRMRETLDRATPNSLIVMNEIFSSTSLKDAIYLGRKIMARISDLDLLAVCVTFVDELSSFNEKTVSMVSRVNPLDPAVRTYKVERVRADGLAYALAIAERHRVTYDRLLERIRP